MFRAEPFDIEGVARNEMLQPLHLLRWAGQVAGAPADRLALLAQCRRLEGAWTLRRKGKFARALAPLFGYDADHLRDDVAGALHHHRIAFANVLAGDFIFIVQGRPADHHAADGYRFQLGHRRQRAGPADLDRDLIEDRLRLFRRELMGGRPARRAADHAEPVLPVEPVDLVHHAVDVVGQRRALRQQRRVHLKNVIHRAAEARQGVGRQAPLAEPLQNVPMGIGEGFADLAQAVGEQPQRPLRGYRGVQLPQASGSRVARIGEDLLVRLLLPGIEREEVAARHVDFAPDLQQRRRGGRQFFRDLIDGAEVCGNVLADRSVAAGRAEDERAAPRNAAMRKGRRSSARR